MTSPNLLRLLFLLKLFLLSPAQKPNALEDKVRSLVDLRDRSDVIRFDSDKFKEFCRSAPRNYSVIVMFTALVPERQCHVCKEASSEYLTVARSWKYSPNFSDKLFIAMVDYDEGQEAFQLMKLNYAPGNASHGPNH